MISRKKRIKYKTAAAQLAAVNNISINLDNWDEIWNLLDKYELPTYVYVIGNPHESVVKIGRSQAPGQRLKALQTSYPDKLYLWAYCPESDTISESLLHKELEQDRAYGEWFYLTSDVQKTIDKIKELGRVATPKSI